MSKPKSILPKKKNLPRHPSSSSRLNSIFAIRNNHIIISILAFSFVGFLDAVYLTILGITRGVPPCTVTHGCERVLTSQFAYLGPIPIAVFGVGYFIVVMILSIQLLQKYSALLMKVLLVVTTLAFISGLGLISIQAMILRAFCQYCLVAELMMTLIFLTCVWLYFRTRKHHTPDK